MSRPIKFLGYMKDNGITIKDLAHVLGICWNSAQNKVCGNSDFKAGEIRKIARKYKLTDTEICDIFDLKNND